MSIGGCCRAAFIIESPEWRKMQDAEPLIQKSEVGISPIAFPQFRLCVLLLYRVVHRACREGSGSLVDRGVCVVS